MSKTILVALDDSENSAKALDFLELNMPKDSRLTLMAVVPGPASACGMDSPSLTPVFNKNKTAFCALESQKEAQMRTFMEDAKNHLVKEGFAPDNITVLVQKPKAGVARDILSEARNGGYKSLVIGRRGHTGIKEFLFGSVSNKVVQQASGITVIVVD